MLKGLGNLANLGSLMKQAQQMGTRLQSLTEELKTKRVSGSSGGGMITVDANGVGEVLACRIDPSVENDREMIEDLLPAAVNQALEKARQLHAEAMRGLTGGLDMSGLNDALTQLGDESGGASPPS